MSDDDELTETGGSGSIEGYFPGHQCSLQSLFHNTSTGST